MKTNRWTAAVAVAMLLFTVWLGTGCKSTTNEPAPYRGLVALDFISAVAANQDSFYLYRVQAGADDAFDSVVCEVYSAQAMAIAAFTLYDDGGFDSLPGPDWTSRVSGDVTPHNGTFTRRVNVHGMISGLSGTYYFKFVAYLRGGADRSITESVSAQNVEDCVVTSTNLPPQFSSCFDPINITVRVSKSAPDVVDSVRLVYGLTNLFLSGEYLTASSGDTVWTMQMKPTFFECPPMAETVFPLTYYVKTRFGMTCSFVANSATYYINAAPGLTQCTLPDTLYRPLSPLDTTRIIVTMLLQDCEYLASRDFDSYTVHYDVSRDDMAHWSPPNPAFVLFDNSVAPDGRPFDGTWAGGLSITYSDVNLNNVYYFRYYAADCGHPPTDSPYLLDSVRVIQPTAPAKTAAQPWVGNSNGFVVLP
jgi:hypothetical protein